MAGARSAVVVGAGIGGLAAAGALARTGWRVTLLERSERLRGEPTALLLWPGGVRALRELALAGGLDAIATGVPDPGLRAPDGRWLVQPRPAAGGSGSAGRQAREPVLVHAEDLHDALFAGLGDRLEIRTGVAVQRLAPGDRPAVTDGRHTWDADLVVAADGADSVLRAAVAGRSSPVPAGATTWRAVLPWYRAPRLPADLAPVGHTYRPGYQFFFASLGERGAAGASRRGGRHRYWRATVAGALRPEPPATQLGLLRRWFDAWHPPIGELLAAAEPDDLVQRALRALRPVPQRYAVPVGAGALVLLGDAAHAMAEHLGQGAGLALEDAATLVAAVREAVPGPGLHAAVAGYQAARRPRVAELLRRTRRLGGTGPLARRPPAQVRLRNQAIAAATGWQPPPG